MSGGVLCFGGGETDPAYPDAALYDGKSWRVVSPMGEARKLQATSLKLQLTSYKSWKVASPMGEARNWLGVSLATCNL